MPATSAADILSRLTVNGAKRESRRKLNPTTCCQCGVVQRVVENQPRHDRVGALQPTALWHCPRCERALIRRPTTTKAFLVEMAQRRDVTVGGKRLKADYVRALLASSNRGTF